MRLGSEVERDPYDAERWSIPANGWPTDLVRDCQRASKMITTHPKIRNEINPEDIPEAVDFNGVDDGSYPKENAEIRDED